jgi:hypothetical protein
MAFLSWLDRIDFQEHEIFAPTILGELEKNPKFSEGIS